MVKLPFQMIRFGSHLCQHSLKWMWSHYLSSFRITNQFPKTDVFVNSLCRNFVSSWSSNSPHSRSFLYSQCMCFFSKPELYFSKFPKTIIFIKWSSDKSSGKTQFNPTPQAAPNVRRSLNAPQPYDIVQHVACFLYYVSFFFKAAWHS